MDVKVFTPDFRPRGILPVLGGQCVLRNNDVSTFSIDVNGNSELWQRFDTGWHIALYDEGQQILTGTPDEITHDVSGGIHNITLSGQSHMRWVRDMITVPTPGQPLESQGAEAYYKASGPAMTLIRQMVRQYVGQDARTEHRRPLIVDSSGTGGAVVSVNSRFKNLLEEIQALATLGNVRFNTRMDSTQVRFGVAAGKDLSRAVRLSELNGALTSYSLKSSAPTITDVLVAGQGEGTARTLKHVTGNPNKWGVRVLQFQDRRDTDEIAELVQAGEETLEDAQEKASVTLEATDLPNLRFGHDFSLGDTITVQTTVSTISDVVQSADLEWGEAGRTVTLQVGPVADDVDAPAWVKLHHRLRTDLRQLQAR